MISGLAVGLLATITQPGGGTSPALPPSSSLAAESGARPLFQSGAITADDYPAEAIRAAEQGSVRVELTVSRDGSVSGCRIIAFSGSAALDSATCRIAVERYAFSPARNQRGEPIQSTYTQTVRWHLPEIRGLAFVPFFFALTASFQEGRLVSCRQKTDRNVVGEVGHSICAAMFSGGDIRAVFPPHLSELTRFVAFAPDGTQLPSPLPEWGRMLTVAEAEMRIAADGRILSCTILRSEVAPDISGAGPDNGCGITGPNGREFEPAEVPERIGRTFVATYAVITGPAN